MLTLSVVIGGGAGCSTTTSSRELPLLAETAASARPPASAPAPAPSPVAAPVPGSQADGVMAIDAWQMKRAEWTLKDPPRVLGSRTWMTWDPVHLYYTIHGRYRFYEGMAIDGGGIEIMSEDSFGPILFIFEDEAAQRLILSQSLQQENRSERLHQIHVQQETVIAPKSQDDFVFNGLSRPMAP
jgi:hypothetical protein